MTLPKLATPSYFLEIPSSGKKVKFRPFLVKEEKILLIALQENTTEVLVNAVKEIIESCTFNAINVDELTTYDIEYLFLQIRIKSKGNIVQLQFACQNSDKDNKQCGILNPFEFDLTTVKVENKNTNKKIIIDEETQIGLVMKDPSFAITQEIQKIIDEESVARLYDVIPYYIDCVFQGEQVFDSFTKDEMKVWLEQLTDTQFSKIKEYFDNIPKLSASINITCSKCGYSEEIKLEGLKSFLV